MSKLFLATQTASSMETYVYLMSFGFGSQVILQACGKNSRFLENSQKREGQGQLGEPYSQRLAAVFMSAIISNEGFSVSSLWVFKFGTPHWRIWLAQFEEINFADNQTWLSWPSWMQLPKEGQNRWPWSHHLYGQGLDSLSATTASVLLRHIWPIWRQGFETGLRREWEFRERWRQAVQESLGLTSVFSFSQSLNSVFVCSRCTRHLLILPPENKPLSQL